MRTQTRSATEGSTRRQFALLMRRYIADRAGDGLGAPIGDRRIVGRKALRLFPLLTMLVLLQACQSSFGHLILESGSDIGLDRIPRVTPLTESKFPETDFVEIVRGIERIVKPYVALAEIEATVNWPSQRVVEECLRLEAPIAMEKKFARKAMSLGADALVLIEADISAQNVLNPSTRVYSMFIRALAIRYSEGTSAIGLVPVHYDEDENICLASMAILGG